MNITFAGVFRFLRAGVAGLVATGVDLGVLALLVSGFHVGPRVASLPALVLGGVANFVGNRHFAFRAQSSSLPRQALLYTLVEVAALTMNGLLYDLALRLIPNAPHAYVLVRIVTSHLVFLCWSYPLWQRVFAPRTSSPAEPEGGRLGGFFQRLRAAAADVPSGTLELDQARAGVASCPQCPSMPRSSTVPQGGRVCRAARRSRTDMRV